MAIAPRLELRQGQSLVMTPQLQQAIKLLQLSNIELADYVEHELEQNPLLEREDDSVDGVDVSSEASTTEASVEPASDVEETMDFDPTAPTNFESDSIDAPDDALWESANAGDGAGAGVQEASTYTQSNSSGGSFNSELPNLEETLSGSISLQDHLRSQLTMIEDAVDRLIAVHLIELVDESGYLPEDLSSIAELLGCPESRIEETLALIQQFDPSGIFARNLAECLGLQLRDLNRLDPAMESLLDNLDLLAKRDLTALMKKCDVDADLMKKCDVDADDIHDMVAEIKALNPKPALSFDQVVTHTVTPDVLMRPKAGGGWVIELNAETLPRVLVNNNYYAQISKTAQKKDDKRYLVECLTSANWLVKSLHQRATTILKVSTEIIRQQEAFFLNGVQSLKPLVLRNIADEIEMHESTVSRVTSNKYMATPRGIYELKYFFTPAINNVFGGSSHSAESVRHRIKSLVDDEPAEKILSDDKIVEILKKEGVDIARRTVAKYREAMGIGSSVQRRRQKKAAL